jgi:threonine synthase
MHGAKVLPIDGNFDRALELVRTLSEQYSITLVNSINPYRLEGQKTAAFEIVDALGDAPDILALPVGNAGNITAYWRGFKEYHVTGKSSLLPRVFGFQASGAAPIVLGHPIEHPQTIATAIRIGNPASWQGAVNARDESNGIIAAVTDDEILAAYKFLAQREGIFCEPASAAGVAGILKIRDQRLETGDKRLEIEGKRVVCVLTGHGLKDPDTALGGMEIPEAIPATMEALLEAIGL